MEQRLPFNLLDEIFVHNRPMSDPMNGHVEIRVGGRLDEERLRKALSRAMALHPRSRARLAPWSHCQRGFEWIIDEQPMDETLSVIDLDGDADEARAEFLNKPFSFDRSPQIRLLLFRCKGGDRLVLSMNHACGDGIGALRFFRSLACAYAGEPDSVPAALPVTLGADPERPLRGALSPRGLLLDAMWGLVRASPTTHVARESDGSSAKEGLRTLIRPSADLEHSPLRRDGATFNDLLLAGLHLSIDHWNRRHGMESGHIALHMPVNARPAAWQDEILGNFVAPDRISTTAADRVSPSAVVRAIAEETVRTKERLALARIPKASSFGIPIGVRIAAAKVLRSAMDPFVDTSVLSNLGRLEDRKIRFGSGLELKEAYASPPTMMPMGVCVAVCRLQDTLFIGIRYSGKQFTHAAARAFGDLFLRELDALALGQSA